jgi:hypothetical protein
MPLKATLDIVEADAGHGLVVGQPRRFERHELPPLRLRLPLRAG